MNIAIFVYGTWGDLRPHVRLGMELQKLGHDVQVVASEGYESWVRERGLGFSPLSVDVNVFTRENAAIMEKSVFKQLQIARNDMPDIFATMGLETLEATRDSDVLITVEFGIALLIDILKANNIKPLLINPAPLNPTGEFTMAMPEAPDWFPFKQWYNRTSYNLVRRITWSVMGGARKRIAKAHPELPKSKFGDLQALLATTPALTSVSKYLVPRPADWNDYCQVTGYLFDDDPEWTPPQDLVDFLDVGDAPVYIGFGSMPDGKPEATTRLIIDAVKRSGKRAVILSGWAGLGAEDVPDSIYVLKYAPHTWLFPRMAAVIHHGGSGTTASGLRAGKPTTIVPHTADQPYWGRTIEKNGLGTAPIPRKKLTIENLAEAIQMLTSNATYRENAQALGAKIEQEDGLGEAVKWVQHYFEQMQ